MHHETHARARVCVCVCVCVLFLCIVPFRFVAQFQVILCLGLQCFSREQKKYTHTKDEEGKFSKKMSLRQATHTAALPSSRSFSSSRSSSVPSTSQPSRPRAFAATGAVSSSRRKWSARRRRVDDVSTGGGEGRSLSGLRSSSSSSSSSSSVAVLFGGGDEEEDKIADKVNASANFILSPSSSSSSSSSSSALVRRRRRRRRGSWRRKATSGNKDDDGEQQQQQQQQPRGGGGDDDDDNENSTKTTVFLGVPITPETSAIALVYFVQGVIGLASLAKSFFLKDELHLSPSEAAVVTSISSLPWLVKPLWGFISDTVPLFGYKRKSYLCLMGVLGCVAWSTLSQGVAVVDNRWTASFLFAVGSLSIAFSDVLIDSIVVERARESEDNSTTGSLQSLCWGMVAFGGIASSYFSGELVEEKGSAFVFACTAVFPLLIAGAAFLVNEEKQDEMSSSIETTTVVNVVDGGECKEPETIPTVSAEEKNGGVVEAGKETLSMLWSVVKQKQIWGPALFMYLWQATPSPGSAMFYFSTNELHFSPEFLGRVSFARSLAALGGVGLYNAYFKYVPLKKMFTYSAILATALGSTQLLLVSGYNRELGISDELFALTDSAVLTVLGEISFLPVLVLAAKICPKGVEATLFASLMSLFNFGGVTSQFLGAGLTEKLGVTADNFDNLFELVTICNFTTLLPLVAIGFLNEVEQREEEGDDSDGEEGQKMIQA